MKLPDAENAYVPPAKIFAYLLSIDNPRGRDKAEFFLKFGFVPEQWQQFAEVLRVHESRHKVVNVRDTLHGPTFAVDGILETPDRRNPDVRTVWIIRHNSTRPALVTAYLSGEKYDQRT